MLSRQTARYVHIGMEDRAEALSNLPTPKSYASVELSGMCRVWGGALNQELSSDDSDDDPDDDPENEKPLAGKRFCHLVSLTFRSCQLT
jgi:hypothetical protein